MRDDTRRSAVRAAAELLRHAREDAQLSQVALAERAGIAPSTVSAYESGRHAPSLAAIERLLGVLGRQLRLESEPVAADIDAAIDAARALPFEERVDQHAYWLRMLLPRFADVPMVVDGSTAAFLQGAPVPVAALEIAMVRDDLQRLHAVLLRINARRWDNRSRDWGWGPVDPALPGELRWDSNGGEVRLRVVDQLPTSVEVMLGERRVPVRPLVEIEADNPAVQRILARLRERLGSAA